MVIYVDIDETICHYEGDRSYELASPILSRIQKVNDLFDKGHEVIYWTARGSQTGIDWTEVTTLQLKKWGAKYNKLEMAKPHYDLFICDKATNSEEFFKV